MRICCAGEGGKEGDLDVSGAKVIRCLRGAHGLRAPGQVWGQRGFPRPRMEGCQGQHFRDMEMQEMTQPSLPSALFSTNWPTTHIPKGKRLASFHKKKKKPLCRKESSRQFAAGQQEQSSLQDHPWTASPDRQLQRPSSCSLGPAPSPPGPGLEHRRPPAFPGVCGF